MSKFKKKRIILFIIAAILIMLIIVSGIKIFIWQDENFVTNKLIDTAQSKIEKIDNNYKVDISGLKEINSDVVGFIVVEGTDVSFPVVKTDNNEFYLKHSLDKIYNTCGWIFMDCKNNPVDFDDNTIIYGHNRRNDMMFGTLKNVLDSKWQEENDLRNNQSFVHYIDENGIDHGCEIFSCYTIENEDYYLQRNFENDSERIDFYTTLKNRSQYSFKAKPDEKNKIITLSTCANDSKKRIAIHCIIK